ncbi:MAG TPA: MFS transporter [Blastocatellia bacterium]|nr:MFS transporter [Blastocatellia bacterium]
MNSNVRWRLSTMMFLQYWIWGAWQPVIAIYLGSKLGYNGSQIGWLFALLPIACMLIPPVGGQLADRWVPTEKLLAVMHLLGAVFLSIAACSTSFPALMLALGAWSVVYAPTLALTNSLTFHHLPESDKKFGLVRVWGTIGWIAAGGALTGLRKLWPDQLPILGGADSLWLGAAGSLVLGFFSFALPGTPPAKTGDKPWAFLEAFKLLKDAQFFLFIAIVFVVSTELQFYYILTSPFLESLGISPTNVPIIMTVAQVAEIGTMLALPWILDRWGVRTALAIGILAWPVRYAVFAYGQPRGLVIAVLTLHGLCYVCFFVVAYIHVNSVAAPDIRASAQALITFVSLGMGMAVGSIFAGWIRDLFATGTGTAAVVDYTKVFLVPCGLTVLCAIVFFLGFKQQAAPVQLSEQKAEG